MRELHEMNPRRSKLSGKGMTVGAMLGAVDRSELGG